MDLSTEIIGILRLAANQPIAAACGYGNDASIQAKAVAARHSDNISLLEPLPLNGRRYIVVSAPILNRQRERQGADLVIMDTNRLQSIVSNTQPMGRN